MNVLQRCHSCRWAVAQIAQAPDHSPQNGGADLICRVNPPTPLAWPVPGPGGQMGMVNATVWPQVRPSEFCSRWEPVPITDPAPGMVARV